jgi:hypothetical protein
MATAPLLPFHRPDPKAPRWVKPSAVTLDEEFRNMLPRALPEQVKQMADQLALAGSRDPLNVWVCPPHLILLTGYDLYDVLRKADTPFQVTEWQLATRLEARRFIIRHQLIQKNAGKVALSYLRGLCYVEEKRRPGDPRPRPTPEAMPPRRGKTADALAEMLAVNRATIRRDGALAAAIDRLEERYGPEAKLALLSAGNGLSHAGVLALDRMEPDRQRAVICELILNGKVPRGWRTQGVPETITLPRDLQGMARMLIRRLGPEAAASFSQILIDLLANGGTPPGSAPA